MINVAEGTVDVVIPARLASTRLPGKLLLNLAGKPVIQRTYEQVQRAPVINHIFIATDSEEIAAACKTFTHRVIMTRNDHQSGTDRIAEAARHLSSSFIINVQGDEPFMDPDIVSKLALLLKESNARMVSGMGLITNETDLMNPAVVKVVVNEQQEALYFSRSPIPWHRDSFSFSNPLPLPAEVPYFRHYGIYGYQRNFLLQYSQWPQGKLEQVEKLEQLRVLENGFNIKMLRIDKPIFGIDTPADLEKARHFINANP
mgnify:FL=1